MRGAGDDVDGNHDGWSTGYQGRLGVTYREWTPTLERVAVGNDEEQIKFKNEVVASAIRDKEVDTAGNQKTKRTITTHVCRGGGADATPFVAILKNCRSLTSEERFEELLSEMRGIEWDAILCSETRRETKEEFDTLGSGHMWLGSGGTAGKHGVGILLHERWANSVHRWRALSPRLGLLELNTGRLKLTLAVVYMPHCGYSDVAVEEMYQKLSSITRESRSRKRLLVIAGDWNAEVKSDVAGYCKHDVVGKHANASGNARGDWLKRWATAERIALANTHNFRNDEG